MEGTKLLHADLSFIIRGVLYQVHNELGQFWGEKHYCDAIENKFKILGIMYVREYAIPVSFVGEKPGRSRVDFLIDNKIILEIKVVPSFSPETFKQCMRYLVASGKDLLLLVNFYYRTTSIKRILNPRLLITSLHP